jgi:uncharacterized protein
MAIIACGGGLQATQTGATTAVKSYKPLEIKADAKSPSQAVILGTDDKDRSTVLPLPADAENVLVDAMFVALGSDSSPTGGYTPVKLATAPNATGTVQVAIVEELSSRNAPWHSGVWVSAFVAAATLGKDLTDFTFSASSGGNVDGASASGLIASGFLAALTGAPVDPTATLTGIVNPDGTIGPVGGIPEKFLGSLAKGKKKLGFPIGMRFAKSEASGQLIDVVQLAKDHGAVAIEIANVREAYKLLTGNQLPEPVPVSAAEMALNEETGRAIDSEYKEWQKRLSGDWATLLQLGQSGRLPSELLRLAKLAQSTAEHAEKLHQQGLLFAAYRKMLDAWVYAASATETYNVLASVQANNIAGAVAKLGALDEQTTDVFKKVGTLRPATLGSHLQMISAFQAALRGWGFKTFAADRIASTKRLLESLADNPEVGSAQVAEAVVGQVMPTMLLLSKTASETALANQVLEFETESSVNYGCSIPNVKRLSAAFQSASAAGIHYFDRLVVQPLAEQARLTENAARQRIAMVEPDYLVAYMTAQLPSSEVLAKELKATWGESSIAWGLMSLAGNELAYSSAAQLIAKHYSLDVHTDASGRPDRIRYDKAFIHMLASAEHSARASARAARIAIGSIPIQAKLAYQLAVAERAGDLADQLDALAAFWTSSAYSQMAVALARN